MPRICICARQFYLCLIVYRSGNPYILAHQPATAPAAAPATESGLAGFPLRTCVGCRVTAHQSELVRFVLDQTGGISAVAPDPKRRATGRGAWVHGQPACVTQAITRRAFHRALRAGKELDISRVAAFFAEAWDT